MGTHPRILTIAGSDSGGGAGIQADLKTFTVLGAYGMSVITALTAQNTREVTGIEACSPEFAARQLAAVLDDIPPDAAKTGMLFSASIIEAIAPLLGNRAFPLVVDPVCVATSGARLLEESAVQAMAERLFPLADLVTPNISEAEVFSGMDISESDHIITALERILALGPRAVLIKGGHFGSAALTDWLGVRGEKPLPLMHPRVETANLHGTGCTLSAAIADGLGRGLDMLSAVVRAQRFLELGLRASFNPGGGNGPVNHLARIEKLEAAREVPDRLERLVEEIGRIPGIAGLVPEDGLEPVLALPHADGPGDIAGYGGCVGADYRGRLAVSGRPVFGASPGMGAALLAARRARPEFSCALRLRAGKAMEEAAARAGLTVAWFDRGDYPDATARERDILEWGVRQALSEHPEALEVDAVCDWGGLGKPPRLRIFARDEDELAARTARLAKAMEGQEGEWR